MRRTTFRMLALVIVSLMATSGAQARSKRRKKPEPSSFAYYLLVLSYAPDFCAEPGGVKDPRECGNGRNVGFVVHGLWPQGETTRGPENCGSASPVARGTVNAMLQYIPTESLIQHEWKAHGTCSGLSADDYFAAVKKARDSIKIPDGLTPAGERTTTAGDIEAAIAGANPSFPKTAFRTSCYPDKKLQEVRICLNKDLSPRACGNSAGECQASNIVQLPVH